jgi:hypothetical protein
MCDPERFFQAPCAGIKKLFSNYYKGIFHFFNFFKIFIDTIGDVSTGCRGGFANESTYFAHGKGLH